MITRKSTYLFMALCHLLLAVLFTYSNRRRLSIATYGLVAYAVAHTLIAYAFHARARDAHWESETEKIARIGSCAHGLLILYALSQMAKSGVSRPLVVFTLAQLGMIYHYQHHTRGDDVLHEALGLRKRHIFLLTFMTLVLYYVHAYIKERKLYKHGLAAVLMVYIISILTTLYTLRR